MLKPPSPDDEPDVAFIWTDADVDVADSVTRRQYYFLNIWLFETMKICPKA